MQLCDRVPGAINPLCEGVICTEAASYRRYWTFLDCITRACRVSGVTLEGAALAGGGGEDEAGRGGG